MQLISLGEVLRHMDSTAEPFSLVFSTADRKRRTGGELLRLEGCVKTGGDKEPMVPTPAAVAQTVKRKPGHRANQTINVTILSSGKVRKLHVRLLTEFNGHLVRW